LNLLEHVRSPDGVFWELALPLGRHETPAWFVTVHGPLMELELLLNLGQLSFDLVRVKGRQVTAELLNPRVQAALQLLELLLDPQELPDLQVSLETLRSVTRCELELAEDRIEERSLELEEVTRRLDVISAPACFS
jgi:hypothetical protein